MCIRDSLLAASISLIHAIPSYYIPSIIGVGIPVIVLVLFLQVIISNMKYNFKDIAITLFGICYIVVFLMFIPLLRGIQYGNLLIWYIFAAAWGTDIMAYLVGRAFGKHKFSKVSPNKSVEGCIGGTIGAILLMGLLTFVYNTYFGMDFSYGFIVIVSVVLSAIGQIGDFAASSIKRYTGIKDFSNLIPGHGGLLDRIDSVIFIAPFAYVLFSLMFGG